MRSSRSAVASISRSGLGLFLLLLIYDGAIRKWVISSGDQLVFIVKDLLLAGLLLYVVSSNPSKVNAAMGAGARTLFLFYVLWVFLELVNLHLPNVLVGVWGLKAHVLYASLILLLPTAFNNLSELFCFLVKIYPLVVLPVCALAFVQLSASADSTINLTLRGGADAQSYFGEANLVRVSSTFSYLSGMGSFVQTMTALGLGLFLGGARSRFFLLGLVFVLAALPATGSRSVIVVSLASAVIMLLGSWYSRLIFGRMVIHVVVGIAFLGALSLLGQDEAWVALQQRAEEASYDEVRIFTAFTNAFDFFDTAGFFGFGAGAANLGAIALVGDQAPFSWLPVGEFFEEESGRIVLEIGIFGWLLSMLMRFAFLLWAVNLMLISRRRTVTLAAVMALPVMALGLYVGNGVFAVPLTTSYYWFCVALLAMAQFENRQAFLQDVQSSALK